MDENTPGPRERRRGEREEPCCSVDMHGVNGIPSRNGGGGRGRGRESERNRGERESQLAPRWRERDEREGKMRDGEPETEREDSPLEVPVQDDLNEFQGEQKAILSGGFMPVYYSPLKLFQQIARRSSRPRDRLRSGDRPLR